MYAYSGLKVFKEHCNLEMVARSVCYSSSWKISHTFMKFRQRAPDDFS